MSCGVGHRLGLDMVLLWLWCRLVAAASYSTPILGTSICQKCSPLKKKSLHLKGVGGNSLRLEWEGKQFTWIGKANVLKSKGFLRQAGYFNDSIKKQLKWRKRFLLQ